MLKKTKLKISIPTIIFFGALLFFENSIISYIPFLCALLHEMGHIVVMKIFEIKIYEIKILPFGIDIKKENCITSYKSDIIIGSAGIFTNLLLIICSIFLPQNNVTQFFILSNILLILINILPIKTLDGGQILEKYLSMKFDIQTAENIVSALSFICIILLGSVAIWLLLYSGYNFTLFLMCVYLFFGIFIK